VVASGTRTGAAFTPGWSGTRSPKSISVEGTRTKGRAFSPRLTVLVGKPGLEGISQPGLKPTPALVLIA
jgi:hypothetical protein